MRKCSSGISRVDHLHREQSGPELGGWCTGSPGSPFPWCQRPCTPKGSQVCCSGGCRCFRTVSSVSEDGDSLPSGRQLGQEEVGHRTALSPAATGQGSQGGRRTSCLWTQQGVWLHLEDSAPKAHHGRLADTGGHVCSDTNLKVLEHLLLLPSAQSRI